MDQSRLDERHVMVREQLQKRGIRNPWLLQAVLDIPRHLFVPPDDQNKAYEDGPLPIGCGQTISQPFVGASMIELLDPQSSHRVLEVGVGSGYSACLLARLVKEVFGVEKEASLLAQADKRLKALGIGNAQWKQGDGSLGWPEEAPFDGILVSAAAPRIPKALLEQLKEGGSMVIPVGERQEQELVRVVKGPEGHYQEKVLYRVKFVPLIGQEGWSP